MHTWLCGSYMAYADKHLKKARLGKLVSDEESVAVLHMQSQWSPTLGPFFIPQALKILTLITFFRFKNKA